MRYIVTGGTKFQRHVAKATVDYMSNTLKLTRFSSLTVEIILKVLEDGYKGFCIAESVNDKIVKPRSFVVEINKGCTLMEFITTICHEMIHVKQYAFGEIQEDFRKGRSHWKTKTVPAFTSYIDQPWEKEAFKYEVQYAFEVFGQVDINFNGE